jgi:peptide/nickel transport system substrate-binding protein
VIRALRLAILAAAAVLVVTPDAPAATARHSWTQPDVLRVGANFIPRTLDPILATTTVESALFRLTNSLLVTADGRGNFVPDLAAVVPTQANGGISRDGRTITYHLRKNVKWHDGVPFTSDDVKFTYDAIMNPKNNVVSRHGYDLVDRVTTPDRYTVVFHYTSVFAPAIATVFGDSDSPYGIIPRHLLGKLPDVNDAPYNAAPIGTGPFKIVKWYRGDRIEYVANDDYFLGKPKLRRIIVKLIPDENTLANQLRTHEIDWFFEATANVYQQLKTMPDTSTILAPLNGYVGVMMQTQHPALADVRVRRAISLAVDRDRIVRDLTFGAAQVATGDLPPFMWAHDASIGAIRPELPQAMNLLDAAGWRRGSDGMRSRDGKPLSLDLVYESGSDVNKRLAVQLQSALHAVGIDVRPRPLLSTLIYGAAAAGGTLASGQFDLGLYPWFAGLDPDDSSQFTCANRAPAGYNESRYCSPTMDAAQRTALGTFDRAKRKAAYAAIERELVANVPLAFFFYPRNVQAFNPDFHGLDPNPTTETWNAYAWSI